MSDNNNNIATPTPEGWPESSDDVPKGRAGRVLVVCDEEDRVLPFSIGTAQESASELAQRLRDTLARYGSNSNVRPVALQDMTTDRMIPLSFVARHPMQVPDKTGYRVICTSESNAHDSGNSNPRKGASGGGDSDGENAVERVGMPPPMAATRPPSARNDQTNEAHGMQPNTEIVWDYFSPRKDDETQGDRACAKSTYRDQPPVSQQAGFLSALRSLILAGTLTVSEASSIWADLSTCQIITESAVDTQALIESYVKGDMSFQKLTQEVLQHHTKREYAAFQPHPRSENTALAGEGFIGTDCVSDTAENVVRLAYIVQELQKEGVDVVSRDQLRELGVLDSEELAVLDKMVEEAHTEVVRAFEETLRDLSSHGLALRLVAAVKDKKKLESQGESAGSRPCAPTPNEGLVGMRILEDLHGRGDISSEEEEIAQELMEVEDRDFVNLMEAVENVEGSVGERELEEKFLSGLRSVLRQKLRTRETISEQRNDFRWSLLKAASNLYEAEHLSADQFRTVKEKISENDEYLLRMYLKLADKNNYDSLYRVILSSVFPDHNSKSEEAGLNEENGYRFSVFHNDVVEGLRHEGKVSGSDSTVLRHLWADGDLMVQAAWENYRHDQDLEDLKDTLLVVLEREKMQLVESHDHSIHVVEGLRSLHCLTENEAKTLKSIVEHDRESHTSPQEENGGGSPISGGIVENNRGRSGSATTECSIGVRTKAANEVAAAIEQYMQDRDVAELVSRLKNAANNRSTMKLDRQPSLSSVGPTMDDPSIPEHSINKGVSREFAEIETHHPEDIIGTESQSKLLALVSELFHHGLCTSAEASALSRLVNAQDERLLSLLETHHQLSETPSIEALEELAHSLRTLGDLIEEQPADAEQIEEDTSVNLKQEVAEKEIEPRAVSSKHQYLLQLFLSRNRRAKDDFSSEDVDQLMELARQKSRHIGACIEAYELNHDADDLVDSLQRLLQFEGIKQ